MESVSTKLPATQVPTPTWARAGESKPASPSSQARGERAVEGRIAELQTLGMADDAGSLGMILSELDNPDVQIRDAALQATIQFGSREALPALQEEALRTDDAQFKSALQRAIEYLSLPSLTELLESRRQAAPAAGSPGSR